VGKATAERGEYFSGKAARPKPFTRVLFRQWHFSGVWRFRNCRAHPKCVTSAGARSADTASTTSSLRDISVALPRSTPRAG